MARPLSWLPPIALLLLGCIIIIRSVPCAAVGADGLALLAFLDTFPDSSAARAVLSRSWQASDATPCAWLGVSCSSSTQRVLSLSLPMIQGGTGGAHLLPQLGALSSLQHLSLPSLNLTGSIPSHLANCTSLLSLDLSDNNLTGSIPPELGALSRLHFLHLEQNQLQGSIPPQLGLCSRLVSLTLHDNKLSGGIPPELGLLSHLQIFRAGGNILSGPLPPELGNCSSLTQLGLAATRISGALPPELGRLRNLTTIMLFQANLSGSIPPELGQCTQLTFVHLFQNRLTGPLPKELGNLRSLQRLNLWQNELSGSIPLELGFIADSLDVLDLSQNRLSGSIPPTLGRFTAVSKLYLSANFLSGSIPAELGECASLTDLQLDRNHLSGAIPPELGKLSNLVQLFLWNNSLEGHIPASLGNCKQLEFLDFSWNSLTGPIPEELFGLKSLHKFLLLSNQLSGEIPSSIAGCISLYRLRLGRNNFSGVIPREIGQLQNLTFIDVSRNQFSGAIPPTIANCKALQLLDAHDNYVTGTIPGELGLLPNLQSIDLSSNQLGGRIPDELGTLYELTKLNLMGNALSGTIPAELGGCRKLTMLDLSSNALSGSIPPSLGRIKTLSVALNLSCNQLSGPIPQEFSELFSLGALDISHNRLSGDLDVFGAMGSLVTLNISYNLFSGPLPYTYIFTSMPSSNYAGNPGICRPSCFLNSSTGGRSRGLSRGRAIIGFLFGSVGIMFAVGSFLLCLMVRSSAARVHEPDDMQGWPWLMTAFQKVSFTVEDVLDRLVESNIIGKGCSGVVYKAEMPQGEIIAVKKVANCGAGMLARRDVFAAEVEALRSIRHVNIVRLLGYCTNHQVNLLLYDYLPNGSLGEILHEKRRFLDWDTRYKIALGAAQALAYLHHDCVPPILHRDIKANNILLGARLEPYLADFGLAKVIAHDSPAQTQSVVAGSYGYIAPEYAYTLNISDKSDVYSYGVVLLEMLTGRTPVEEASGRHLTEWVREMRHCHHDVTETLDPRLRGMPDPFVHEMLQALGIAMDCVHPVPEERPNMRHVVSLLVGIRHEVEEYAKLDVLAAAGGVGAKAPSCNARSSTTTTTHTHGTSTASSFVGSPLRALHHNDTATAHVPALHISAPPPPAFSQSSCTNSSSVHSAFAHTLPLNRSA